MRLDKYLADCGIGTRSEVKKYIRWGRVKINGKGKTDPEYKVSDDDVVEYNGNILEYNKYYYYIMNKPAGVITATKDPECRTVMDVLKDANLRCPAFDELSPVGRLDKDTEGLLLITNDGALAHDMTSPKKHVNKVYYAETAGKMSASDIEAFERGIELSDFKTLPAVLEVIGETEVGSKVRITIHEGKFHQVKRMVQAVGKEVIYLKRLQFGSLRLANDLRTGNYRALTPEEIRSIKNEED